MSVSGAENDGHRLRAVLFDMDGTLVDTERFWIAAEYELVAAHGGTWTDEHAHHLIGRALLDSGAYIRDHGPVPLAPAEIVDELLARVIDAARHDAPIRPGVRELIERLRAAGVPRAMVTMSYENLARVIADQLGPDAFDVIIAGDHVELGKPHPEPYLRAAAALGVPAQFCVAIEDSPTGIASALAAGCAVLAVPNEVPIIDDGTYTVRGSLTEVGLGELDELLHRPRRVLAAQAPTVTGPDEISPRL